MCLAQRGAEEDQFGSGIAFTEDSLCDVLTDLGAARKDKAMARRRLRKAPGRGSAS